MSDDPLIAEMDVDEVAYPGKAVGRVDGLVTFVPGALAGERVRVQEQHRHKRYRAASLVDVIEPSEFRVAPQCPLADQCPGCRYQHASYAHEVELKSAQFASMLSRMAKLTPTEQLPAVASPRETGYRNKIVLHSTLVGDALKLGYFGEDNTSIVVLAQGCPLAVDPINEALVKMREEGQLRMHPNDTLTLRYTETNGVVHWRGEGEKKTPWLSEQWRYGELLVPRRSFFQVNRDVGNALVDAVVERIEAIKPEMVVDLFCGVGVFALAAAESGVKHVLGVDNNVEAIKAARHNAQIQALPGATFVDVSARDAVQDALEPMDANTGLLVVDPPRSGLHQRVMKGICDSGPNELIYISCGPDTLCRDLKALAAAGYTLASTQIFDMFPRTPHFEVLAHLQR